MDNDALRKAKLAKLIEIEGFDSIEELMEAVFSDAVSPAVCMNEDCNFTCEMEPDQTEGWCDECHTNTMRSGSCLCTFPLREPFAASCIAAAVQRIAIDGEVQRFT